jgi:signal peptidase II
MTDIQSNIVPQQEAKAGFKFPDKKAHMLYWPIVVIGIIADLWSKSAVFAWLDAKEGYGSDYSVIDGFFRLVMRENSGAAFSIARGQTVMLVSVSVLALIVVLGLFLFGRIQGKVMHVGLALFTAGIIGNLYDRVFNNGYVRDFLDVYHNDYHWPAFNIADAMLCTAVGLLLIANIMFDISQRRDHQQTEEL